MITLKRILYWLLAACALVLAFLGILLTIRVVFSSSQSDLWDLVEAPVVFATLLLDFAVEKPAEFLVALTCAVVIIGTCLLVLRYLAQTDWERRKAKWFVTLGIKTGARCPPRA
jgi:hypothetical protein